MSTGSGTEALFEGLMAPLTTAYNADLSLDLALYVEHAQALLAESCVGLVPFGSTGEGPSLSQNDRLHALEALKDAGIDPACMIPGSGFCSLPETAEFSRECFEAGCLAVLVLPPFFFKGLGSEGLFRYFADLVGRISRPGGKIMLYHIPQVAGVGIPPEVVRRLKGEFPQEIAGIKDSSGDLENMLALLSIPGLAVYPGSELPLFPCLERGATGCISATANSFGKEIARTISLYQSGEVERAKALNSRIVARRKILDGFPAIATQKYLVSRNRGNQGWNRLRPPLKPLSEIQGRELLNALEEMERREREETTPA